MELLESPALKQTNQIAKQLLADANSDAFAVSGFCVPCNKNVSFLVDMQSGGQRHANGWMPNWRERLECPLCRMNKWTTNSSSALCSQRCRTPSLAVNGRYA